MILITGGAGQLAREFQRFFEKEKIDFLAPSRMELDITDFDKVRSYILDNDVNLVINCAAYNFVDKAEEEKDSAYTINAYAVENLAKICKEKKIEFVTYSTDFVFDGTKGGAYTEWDEINPISVYGRSKALGERLALEENRRTFVFRVSWVFGEEGKNFIEQVRTWANTRDSIKIATDQVSSPTSTKDIVDITWKILNLRKRDYGIYHISGDGETSRYEQGKYILDKIGYKGKILEGKCLDFTTYDIRPKYSKLSSKKIESILGIKMPSWKSRVDEYLKVGKTYLVTGGAGFIGANFVKYMLKKYKDIEIIILDKLTYAGNLGTIREELKDSRVSFIKGDICNQELVNLIFMSYDIDYVVNFAAESHVDRSIENPQIFLETNILGTQNLMEVAKNFWTVGKDTNGYPIYKEGKKFHHVSTDEVYGSLSKDFNIPKELVLDEAVAKIASGRRNLQTYGKEMFIESSPLDPKSPYSVSKTASDMIVLSYGETYKFPFNITRCSNNYGPYHFPEKLIPLIIKNILAGKKLPVYGKGDNVRDWLYVADHCKGIDMVISSAKPHEIYNIGGFNEEENINIVKLTIDTIARIMLEEPKYQRVLTTDLKNINYDLITYVQDRLGHDVRYAIDPTKIVTELGWYPETPFTEGIEKTIRWYLDNQEWVEEVVSGDYQKYYEEKKS